MIAATIAPSIMREVIAAELVGVRPQSFRLVLECGHVAVSLRRVWRDEYACAACGWEKARGLAPDWGEDQARLGEYYCTRALLACNHAAKALQGAASIVEDETSHAELQIALAQLRRAKTVLSDESNKARGVRVPRRTPRRSDIPDGESPGPGQLRWLEGIRP